MGCSSAVDSTSERWLRVNYRESTLLMEAEEREAAEGHRDSGLPILIVFGGGWGTNRGIQSTD